jgi:hypothetical protein
MFRNASFNYCNRRGLWHGMARPQPAAVVRGDGRKHQHTVLQQLIPAAAIGGIKNCAAKPMPTAYGCSEARLASVVVRVAPIPTLDNSAEDKAEIHSQHADHNTAKNIGKPQQEAAILKQSERFVCQGRKSRVSATKSGGEK